MDHIVKRRGHKELFDERKVYASCYAACLSANVDEYEAEDICEAVSSHIKKWIKKKKEVDSKDIMKEVTKVLKKHDENAAFMYKTHKDIS